MRDMRASGLSVVDIAVVCRVSPGRVSQVFDEGAHAARGVTERAIKNGRLVRPDACQQCGRGAHIDAHHEDYSKPLDVVWLCRKCHARADAARRRREGKVK